MNSPVSAASLPAPHTQLIELPELAEAPVPGAATLLGAHGALLDSVNVSLTVVVGQTHTTLGELLRMKESSVLKLDRAVDVPVDLMVNGNVVARGQLVAVDDHFGVRITELALAVAA